MRTGPLALGYLADGAQATLVDVAGRIAQLTHWEQDNVDAVVLWCLAIRHAILTGEFAPRVGLSWRAPARRRRWSTLIDEATAEGIHPRNFQRRNGCVVRSLQGALAAIVGPSDVREALYRAVRAAVTPTRSPRSQAASRVRCGVPRRCR